MTKKDYELIAQAIKIVYNEHESNSNTVVRIAQELSYQLQEENPRFDIGKFYQACGVAK